MARQDEDLLQEAEEIVAHIRALKRNLIHSPMTDGAEFGMTGPQVMVMATLVERGPMTVTEVSGRLEMSHSTASGIVDRLEARGLVSRRRDQTDGRRTLIEVTEAVTTYVNELEEGPSPRLAAALARATPEERRTIREGLSLLRGLLAPRSSSHIS